MRLRPIVTAPRFVPEPPARSATPLSRLAIIRKAYRTDRRPQPRGALQLPSMIRERLAIQRQSRFRLIPVPCETPPRRFELTGIPGK
jgi:hypothetical protein